MTLGGCEPDADRNRLRILEAAEETLAREGISLPIDAVAKRAGVGAGTLYRHFPTKEALFEAIVMHRLAQLTELAESYAKADDPGQALFDYLHHFATQAAVKKDLLDTIAAPRGSTSKRPAPAKLDGMVGSIGMGCSGPTPSRARTACVTLTIEELMGLVVGACHGTGQMAPNTARIQKMSHRSSLMASGA